MNNQPSDSNAQLDDQFRGFDVPRENWFRLPNEWTDVTAKMRSWAEHKVVEYVLRHTWGYHEYAGLKRISLDEFEHGRRRVDGSRIDHGIGMRRQAIISGIRQAVQDGYLIEEVDASDRGRTKKFYGLHMLAGGGCDDHTPGVCSSYPRGVKTIHRSEKDTEERHQEKKPFAELLRRIADIDQPKARADYVAEYILEQLGDEHSEAFYRLIAAKIPESIIRTAIAEIQADGAREPAKLFTYKMKSHALSRLKATALAVDQAR
jgi:hypothetical protein